MKGRGWALALTIAGGCVSSTWAQTTGDCYSIHDLPPPDRPAACSALSNCQYMGGGGTGGCDNPDGFGACGLCEYITARPTVSPARSRAPSVPPTVSTTPQAYVTSPTAAPTVQIEIEDLCDDVNLLAESDRALVCREILSCTFDEQTRQCTASDFVVNRPPTRAPSRAPSPYLTTGPRRSTTPDPADLTTIRYSMSSSTASTSAGLATSPAGGTPATATSSAGPTTASTTANPVNDTDPCAFVDEMVPDVAREFVCEHMPDDLCRFTAGRCIRTPCLLVNHLSLRFQRQACESVPAGQCGWNATGQACEDSHQSRHAVRGIADKCAAVNRIQREIPNSEVRGYTCQAIPNNGCLYDGDVCNDAPSTGTARAANDANPCTFLNQIPGSARRFACERVPGQRCQFDLSRMTRWHSGRCISTTCQAIDYLPSALRGSTCTGVPDGLCTHARDRNRCVDTGGSGSNRNTTTVCTDVNRVPVVVRQFICNAVPDEVCAFSTSDNRCTRNPCSILNKITAESRQSACEAVTGSVCRYDNDRCVGGAGYPAISRADIGSICVLINQLPSGLQPEACNEVPNSVCIFSDGRCSNSPWMWRTTGAPTTDAPTPSPTIPDSSAPTASPTPMSHLGLGGRVWSHWPTTLEYPLTDPDQCPVAGATRRQGTDPCSAVQLLSADVRASACGWTSSCVFALGQCTARPVLRVAERNPCAFINAIPITARAFACSSVPDGTCRYDGARCTRAGCFLANFVPAAQRQAACQTAPGGHCTFAPSTAACTDRSGGGDSNATGCNDVNEAPSALRMFLCNSIPADMCSFNGTACIVARGSGGGVGGFGGMGGMGGGGDSRYANDANPCSYIDEVPEFARKFVCDRVPGQVCHYDLGSSRCLSTACASVNTLDISVRRPACLAVPANLFGVPTSLCRFEYNLCFDVGGFGGHRDSATVCSNVNAVPRPLRRFTCDAIPSNRCAYDGGTDACRPAPGGPSHPGVDVACGLMNRAPAAVRGAACTSVPSNLCRYSNQDRSCTGSLRTRWTTAQPDFGSFCALVDHIPRSSHRQGRGDCALVPDAACIYTRTGGYGDGYCSRAPPPPHPPPPSAVTTAATTTHTGGGGGGHGGGGRDGGGGNDSGGPMGGPAARATTMVPTAVIPPGPQPTSYSSCYVNCFCNLSPGQGFECEAAAISWDDPETSSMASCAGCCAGVWGSPVVDTSLGADDGTGSGADEVGDIVAVVVVALVVIVAVVVIAAIKVKKRRAAWLAAAAGGAGTGMGMSGRDYTGFSNPSYSDRDYAGDDLDSADDGSPSRPTSADALYGHGPDFVNEGAEGSAGITGYLEIDPAPHAE